MIVNPGHRSDKKVTWCRFTGLAMVHQLLGVGLGSTWSSLAEVKK